MLRMSLMLYLASAVMFIVSLFVWGTPALGNITIRAPTSGSGLLDKIREIQVARKKNMMLAELSNIELFISRMLTSGVYSVHEIIEVAADMSDKLKPHFQRCYNRYFAIGNDSITQMKSEINDDTFDILCDTLVYASIFNKQEMGKQVSEHLDHLKRLRAYKRQQVISHKETKFAFAMILPIGAFLIVQLYPWIVQAAEQMSIIW